jgi:hypothetical protein
MIWVAAGIVLLAALVGGLRAFAGASVAGVKTGLAVVAAAIGLLLAAALLIGGRGSQVVWTLLLFGPAAWRWWRARRPPAPLGPPPDTVDTARLSMLLDPASGTLSGRVTAGHFAGRDLADLTVEELRALLSELSADDPEGVPLLEAWLDRAHPGWREPARDTPSERAEALAILGLEEGAGPAEIRAAHARMMRTAHPDAGGSDWLAARLNAARDVLLG